MGVGLLILPGGKLGVQRDLKRFYTYMRNEFYDSCKLIIYQK